MRFGFVMWSLGLGMGLGVGLLLGQAATAQGWAAYSPDGGRYRIDMPGTPKVAVVPIPLGGGETRPMTEAGLQAGRVAYVASWIDYPERIARAASTDLLLDRVRDGMSAGHTVRGEKKLTMGRFPGREFLVVQADGNNTATRLWWVRGRLYQLTVTDGVGIEGRPETRRYFESFNLITP